MACLKKHPDRNEIFDSVYRNISLRYLRRDSFLFPKMICRCSAARLENLQDAIRCQSGRV